MLGLSRPVLLVIFAAATMLTFSMGIRQSLGLFMQPLTRDIGVSVADFTLAIAAQNLIWGFTQPLAGGMTVRYGFRTVMTLGALCYAAGVLTLALAQGQLSVALGAGAFIGIGLSCTASAIAMSVGAKIVSAAQRSMILGVLSAAGSIGALLAAPIGQWVSTGFGWRMGMFAFLALACIMIPAAWIAGRVDRMAPSEAPTRRDDSTALQALRHAVHEPSFMIMSCTYFVCGMQLVFLTTHLPSYLAICGMDPMLSAQALGMIGGFNVLGSLFFGWAGGRWNKLALLGAIYVARSLVLAWYFVVPPTPGSTLVFASIIGFLWLGVAPLVAGAVAEMFGLKWQAMLQGVAFMGHQVGSFFGAFGGGLLFEAAGTYDMAWRAAVATGLVAGLMQITCAFIRPSEQIARQRQLAGA